MRPEPPSLLRGPDGRAAAELAEAIAGRAGGTGGAPQREVRTVVDTADRRLQRAGLVLERVERDGADLGLALRRVGLAAALLTAPASGAGVADLGAEADVPAGRLGARARRAAKGRPLLAVARYEVEVHPVTVRDEEGKAVARAAVDRLADGSLLVRVEPLRGYERAGAALAKAASREGCEPAGTDPAATALADSAAVPDRRRGRTTLDGDAPAAAGWVAALRAELAGVDANVEGARDGSDPERLHDVRIAVRRSRSILKHASGVLPDELVACFGPELKAVQEATGPMRDLDVWVAAADSDLAGLRPDDAAALTPFRALLGERRAAAHAALVAYLDGPAFTAFLDDWRATLQALGESVAEPEAGEWGPWPADAHRPLREVAERRVRARRRRLLRDGRAVDDGSPATDLHELRKQGKELRYLLEVFGPLLPKKRTAPLVKALKALQDVLGEHQDTEVQGQALRSWAVELAGEAPGTLVAIGELVERLAARQRAARAAFPPAFASFAEAGS